MSELASVTTEPEPDRYGTIQIKSCANGWVVREPGSIQPGEWVVFTSLWDLKNWITDHLVDNT